MYEFREEEKKDEKKRKTIRVATNKTQSKIVNIDGSKVYASIEKPIENTKSQQ